MSRRHVLIRATGGTTMVEVIVAFLILIIVLEIFSQAVVLTGRMVQHSGESLRENRNLAGSYYLEGKDDPEDGKAEEITPVAESIILHFQSESGASFQIPAKVRTFTGERGNLCDVMGIRSKEDDRLKANTHTKENRKPDENDSWKQNVQSEKERDGT